MLFIITMSLLFLGFAFILSLRYCCSCKRYYPFWKISQEKDICVKCKASLLLLCLTDSNLNYQKLLALLRKDH